MRLDITQVPYGIVQRPQNHKYYYYEVYGKSFTVLSKGYKNYRKAKRKGEKMLRRLENSHE